MSAGDSAIGAASIGSVAIAEAPSAFAEGVAIEAILAADDVVYACELIAGVREWTTTGFNEAIGAEAIGTSATLTRSFLDDAFYVATTAFGTDSGQTPAETRFHGRLAGFSFRRSINNGNDFGGVAIGDGEITIDNSDGHYDDRATQVIAGRAVVVRVGRIGIPYEFWPVIFRGTAREWNFDEQAVHIAARDDSYRFGVPMQTTLYLGSGGAEGGDDLKDKRKPLLHGYGINVHPPKLNAALVYQLNDGVLTAVFAVRDRGIALTFGADRADYAALAAATIAAGHYDTCLAGGYIRLGSSPDGTITADAATLRSSGAATRSAIIRGIIEDHTAVTRIYDGAFTVLAALYPNDCGVFLDENDNSTVREVLDRLMAGIVGWVAFTRDGMCTVGVLAIPDNPARMYFGLPSILEISYERLPSLLSPPPWRLRLNYFQNATVQTDLSGAADGFYAQSAKVTSAQDSNVVIDNPLAQDRAPRDSFMIAAADADDEVSRQLEIFKLERTLRRVRLPRRALPLEIGNVVDLDYDRLGGHRLGMIIEDDIDVPQAGGSIDTVEVLLYG